MKRFENQSLSKTEMNKVHGGLSYFACTCNFAEAVRVWLMPIDSTGADLEASINSKCSKGGSCGRV